jgi:HPt (histidine-containing phosphotransfer) domain-containing protein
MSRTAREAGVINWQRVAELRDEVGEEDFAEVAELFLEEVAEGLAMFDPGAAPGEVQAQLHALKGSALNLGFSEFAALCASFEQHAAVSGIDAAAKQRLVDSFAASKSQFEEEGGPNPG